MIRRPPRSTHCISSAASDVYKRQIYCLQNNNHSKCYKHSNLFNCISNNKVFNLMEIQRILFKRIIAMKFGLKKWVDYSSKYGLGYLLSNGQSGAFFNDSTKILLDSHTQKLQYVERKGQDKEEVVSIHSLSDYPKELQKKVTLIQHFKNYLENDKKDGSATSTVQCSLALQGGSNGIAFDQSNNIYVKKWYRTKYAIMFRLNNKVVQVIFQDQTEIILSSELKIVTYVNKKHERLTYPLANALESTNQEMSKRLKYTKDILTHMLGGGQSQPDNKQLKHSENTGSKPADQQQLLNQKSLSSINKYPSSDLKSQYVSASNNPNPSTINNNNNNILCGSIQKTESDILSQQLQQAPIQNQSQQLKQNNRLQKLNNGQYSMTSQCFNQSKKDMVLQSGTSIENMQLLKSQSQACRLSLLNQVPTVNMNNYLIQNKKTEF
eukprot:TRINITY_DN11421_c0_g1_i3.p1 TRINITY_DN11421_c0_g1~~TRINITY_DN11421_c0_g1_i3.p1  ORF type:complete len:437 (-),score=73.28 TRINITY_DN11421_c0_g1_i3:111-1421(-)